MTGYLSKRAYSEFKAKAGLSLAGRCSRRLRSHDSAL